jgi:hypothetical protein
MNFEYQFVAHGKIDFLDFTTIESRRSKSDIIYFGIAKHTIVENAVNKGNRQKGALGKITIGERTALKFLEIDFFFAISEVVVFDIKEIVCHFSEIILLF